MAWMADAHMSGAVGLSQHSSWHLVKRRDICIAQMADSGTNCYAMGIPNQTPRNAAEAIERVVVNDLIGA